MMQRVHPGPRNQQQVLLAPFHPIKIYQMKRSQEKLLNRPNSESNQWLFSKNYALV